MNNIAPIYQFVDSFYNCSASFFYFFMIDSCNFTHLFLSWKFEKHPKYFCWRWQYFLHIIFIHCLSVLLLISLALIISTPCVRIHDPFNCAFQWFFGIIYLRSQGVGFFRFWISTQLLLIIESHSNSSLQRRSPFQILIEFDIFPRRIFIFFHCVIFVCCMRLIKNHKILALHANFIHFRTSINNAIISFIY